jgi:hypothetical protein
MNNTLLIGTRVQRLAAETDYTNGRTGEIVEIDEIAGRYRVRWTNEKSGRAINDGKGLRTWVKFQYVRAL